MKYCSIHKHHPILKVKSNYKSLMDLNSQPLQCEKAIIALFRPCCSSQSNQSSFNIYAFYWFWSPRELWLTQDMSITLMYKAYYKDVTEIWFLSISTLFFLPMKEKNSLVIHGENIAGESILHAKYYLSILEVEPAFFYCI